LISSALFAVEKHGSTVPNRIVPARQQQPHALHAAAGSEGRAMIGRSNTSLENHLTYWLKSIVQNGTAREARYNLSQRIGFLSLL
jgi:hypothetical protein